MFFKIKFFVDKLAKILFLAYTNSMKKNTRPQAQKPRYVAKEKYGSSGYGMHEDRRTKRTRTRAAQKAKALKEWS